MSLVWILLTWLPLVLPAVGELPKPISVTVRSTGSGYFLSWDPGQGTPPGTSYSVGAETDSHQFPVSGCQQVQNPLTCNLTATFKDPSVKYDIKVTAELGANRSESAEIQYKPIDHLDLPELTVVSCQSNLCVDLQPPKHHPPWIYKDLGYKLQISSAGKGGALKFKAFRSLETQVLTDLQAGRQYCVSVQFFDSLENKISNFSQPVCVSTSARFSTDTLILSTLILLVLLGLVGLGLLIWTSSLCLKNRPLPLILKNIRHLEEILVQTSTSSLMSVRLVVPPAGAKRSSHSSSEDSDEDCETSCRSSSRRGLGGYTERVGTNLHSSSSSSSSSSSLTTSCSRTPDGSSLQPQTLTETLPRTELDSLSSEGLTRRRSEEEQEQEVGGSAGLGVNLHTLTFGRLEEEGEDFAGPSEESSVSLVPSLVPPPVPVVLPPQFAASSWTVGDEEAPDDTCGYMGRPSADVLQNLLSKT